MNNKNKANKAYSPRDKNGRDAALIEKGILMVLDGMGVNLADSNFVGTPRRVAKMYLEMLTPRDNNWASFPTPSSGMIVLRGHKVYALCPHHLMPVELMAYVAYIPREVVLGLSKLARVVESQLTRPMMQEELGEQVTRALSQKLNTDNVACVLSGEHGCMKYRGVLTDGDVVTSSMKGLFMHAPQTREEFFQIIGRPGK